MQSPKASTTTTKNKSNRKSWFKLNTSSNQVSKSESESKEKKRKAIHYGKSNIKDNSDDHSPISEHTMIPEERLRPIQFSPNRLETLYVTPSERNLYLAAMAQLENPPPPLPLWIHGEPDPTPSLPHLAPQSPVTPLSRQNNLTTDMNLSTMNGQTSWNGGVLNSSKLVTSPQVENDNMGLMIRDEFRDLQPSKTTQHAFMAMTGVSGLRFTGFPINTLKAVERVLYDTWKEGFDCDVDLERLSVNTGEIVWNVKLNGKVWKCTGKEELASIHLIVTLLSTLSTQGWTFQTGIKAARSKSDIHNFLFTYNQETTLQPTDFFAISLPVPDRISLISPPNDHTPAIISALRTAILNIKSSNKSGTGLEYNNDSRRSSIGYHSKRGIKLEGWVHEGVYRFWIDGMRRKFFGGIKRSNVERLQPIILLDTISALSSLHYELVSSIPLLPLSNSRDVLIFSSSPRRPVGVSEERSER